jgi:hypothetical protein
LPTVEAVAAAQAPGSQEEKVTLFRSLFRGRDDVYAIRWRTKDGSWAYRPDGERDWNAILLSDPANRKRVDRETRTLYPLSDAVIRDHLSGRKTIGIYPLLSDETCWLLASDFDKKPGSRMRSLT